MRYFHDAADFRWEIKINLKNVKRVFDETGIDLFHPTVVDRYGRTTSQRLMEEDLTLGEVVVALIGDQIEARRTTADAVREAIGPSQLSAIQEAFFAEYADFFTARKKVFLAEAITKDFEANKTRIAKCDEYIRSETVGKTFNNSPPSPESEPSTAT